MDETTARAELPHLAIEIRHRRLPEEGAEYLSVSLRATPSFGALVGCYLEERNPALAWMAAMTPFAPWAHLMHAAWAPWLAAWSSGLAPGFLRPSRAPPPGPTRPRPTD